MLLFPAVVAHPAKYCPKRQQSPLWTISQFYLTLHWNAVMLHFGWNPWGTPLAISSRLAPARWQVQRAGIAGSTALSLPAAACPWCGCCGWDPPTQIFPAALCRCVFSLQAKWKSWGQLLNECPCSSHPPCKNCPVALVESWLGSSCGRCLCARLGLGWRWNISSSSWCPSSSSQLSSPSIKIAAVPCVRSCS